MARIAVTPVLLVEQAARLSAVPGQLAAAGGPLRGIAGAAQGTAAGQELGAAASAWADAVASYGDLTAETAVGLVVAAGAYVAADVVRPED